MTWVQIIVAILRHFYAYKVEKFLSIYVDSIQLSINLRAMLKWMRHHFKGMRMNGLRYVNQREKLLMLEQQPFQSFNYAFCFYLFEYFGRTRKISYQSLDQFRMKELCCL